MSLRHRPLARTVMLLSLVGCLLSPLAAFGQDTLAEIRKRGVINDVRGGAVPAVRVS